MTFVQNLRSSIQQSFLSFPLLLIGWALFMGASQGNIGLLVLALGQITALPLSVFLTQGILEFVGKKMEQAGWTGSWIPYTTVLNKEVCNLIPGSADLAVPNINVAPSFWMSQTLFFFTFLLSNGISLLTMKSAENADPDKVENRKAQATLSITISSLLLIFILGVRYFVTGCETLTGIAVSIVTAVPLGVGWYYLAKACSARDADIFGIIQKILPPSAQEPPPMTCVYTG